MILCRKRNFLFLRIPKTASTSIAHHIYDNIPNNELDAYSGLDFVPFLQKDKHNDKIGSHPTLPALVGLGIVKLEEINSLNIIAMIRDPIDRFVSLSHHMYCSENKIAFSDLSDEEVCKKYLNNFGIGLFAPQYTWLTSEPENFAKDFLQNHSYDLEKKDLYQICFDLKTIFGNSPETKIKLFKYPNFDKLLSEMQISNLNIKRHHNRNSRPQKIANLSEQTRTEIVDLYKIDMKIWDSLQVS